MKGLKNSYIAAMASLSILSPTAGAQDEFSFDDDSETQETLSSPWYGNRIQLDLGNVTKASSKGGEFSDPLTEDSAFVLGHLDWASITSGGIIYIDVDVGLYGDRYRLGMRSVADWQVELQGSGSQKVEMGDVQTLYPNDSDDILSLPNGYTDSSDASQYVRRDLRVERRSNGLTLRKDLGAWSLLADYNLQEKNGRKSATGSQGFRGTGIVVEPVDYEHKEFKLGLEFSEGAIALGAAYYLSSFNNNYSTLTFPNPNFADIGLAELTLPPSNDFMRLDLDGSLRVNPTSSLTWLLNWSEATQDEDFRPYALDTAFYGDAFSALPETSLDGKVNRLNARLTWTARPQRNFSYKAELRYNNRESRHDPLLLDSVHYDGTVTSNEAPSHVYGKEQVRASLQGNYRFADRSRLRLGLTWEGLDRDRKELDEVNTTFISVDSTDSTDEHRIWAEYKLAPILGLQLAIKAEWADRSADVSDERKGHLHSVSVNSEGTLEAVGENTLPYFLSEREQTRYSANLGYPLTPALMLNASYALTDEEFHNKFDGLNARQITSVDLGLSYAASEYLYLSLYSAWQKHEWDQDGTTSDGAGTVTALWLTEGQDETEYYVAALDWQVVPSVFQLEADLSWGKSDSELASRDSFNNTSGSLPNYGSDVSRLNLSGTWFVNPQTDIQLRYLLEKWQTEDYGWYDGALISGIAFGWQPPDDTAQAIILGVAYHFD